MLGVNFRFNEMVIDNVTIIFWGNVFYNDNINFICKYLYIFNFLFGRSDRVIWRSYISSDTKNNVSTCFSSGNMNIHNTTIAYNVLHINFRFSHVTDVLLQKSNTLDVLYHRTKFREILFRHFCDMKIFPNKTADRGNSDMLSYFIHRSHIRISYHIDCRPYTIVLQNFYLLNFWFRQPEENVKVGSCLCPEMSHNWRSVRWCKHC